MAARIGNTEFLLRPVPKPSHKKSPKRASKNEFSAKTRKAIVERDNGLCVRCGRVYQHIHHITFRSALGGNGVDNGCLVCIPCHQYAHSGREGREYFEKWREGRLDNER